MGSLVSANCILGLAGLLFLTADICHPSGVERGFAANIPHPHRAGALCGTLPPGVGSAPEGGTLRLSAARLNAALSCGDYRIVVTGIHNGGGRDKFITVGIERGAFWRFGDVYARSMGRFHAPRARLSIDIFVKGVSPNGKAARIGIFRSRVFTGLHRLYATRTKILCGKSVHIALDLTTNPKRDVHGVSSADVVVLYQGVVSSDDNVLPNSVQVDEYDSGRYLSVYVGRTHYGAKPRHQWANVAAFCGYVRRPRVRASVAETLRRRSWVVSG